MKNKLVLIIPSACKRLIRVFRSCCSSLYFLLFIIPFIFFSASYLQKYLTDFNKTDDVKKKNCKFVLPQSYTCTCIKIIC